MEKATESFKIPAGGRGVVYEVGRTMQKGEWNEREVKKAGTRARDERWECLRCWANNICINLSTHMVAATHRLTPTTHTTHVRCRIRYVNCCLTIHYQTQISPNIIKCFIVVYHTSNSCECTGIKLVFSSTQSPSWGCAQNTVGILWRHSPIAAEELIVCELNSFEHGAHTVLSLLEISFPVTLLFHVPAHQYNWHRVLSVQYHMIIKLVHSAPPKVGAEMFSVYLKLVWSLKV